MTEQKRIEWLEFEAKLRKEALETGREILTEYGPVSDCWGPMTDPDKPFHPLCKYKLADLEVPKEVMLYRHNGDQTGLLHQRTNGDPGGHHYIHEDEVKRIAVDFFNFHNGDPHFPRSGWVITNREKSFDRFMERRTEG